MGNHPLFFWHMVWIGCVTILKLVSMYEPLFNPSRSIRSKADALHFAILATAHNKCGEPSKIDYEEAEKLFNFFCDHVEFPDDDTKKMTESMVSLMENLLSGKGS